MMLKGCTEAQALCTDLVGQLHANGMGCELPSSSLSDEPVTRKASSLMHKVIGGETNIDVLEAKWLHSVWTRGIHR